MTAIVRLQAATKRYDAAGPPALDGVTAGVAAGESVAVMGPSGSGKSTLLNLVAGLDRPTGGTVEVAGVNLTRLSERRLALFRRAHIGIIFQFFHLLDDLTVRDNVLLPAQLAGARPRAARARAGELLEVLGIAEKASAYPARLSGGQRQRVAIARALVNRPALLLADEPTGAVDARTGAQVSELLRDLARRGQTLLLVTHDPALAGRCASRVVGLHDGRLVREAVPA
jgi:putative ABC transport system ATP-binding protein